MGRLKTYYPISRITGQVVFIGFHLSDNGVNQDLCFTSSRFVIQR